MDRTLPKKKWTKRKTIFIGFSALAFSIIAGIYFSSGKPRLNVDNGRVIISEITKGNFQESIPQTGTVLPLTTIFLVTTEGGRVEEKYVEDGAMLKKDQPILKLANTDLELSLANQETQVFNLFTQMQISHNNAQQNTVNKLTAMADAENAYKEAERVYSLDKRLYDKRVIGMQEFKQAENNYNYYLQKRKLSQQILQQDTILINTQADQDKKSYQRAHNTLDILRKKVNDLIVRAPVDGQITSLDAEIGQSKPAGYTLGQLDVPGGFKVRLPDVDEHYISRIFTGQTGTFTFNDTLYTLKIAKVYTQVANGHFQVDMTFTGKVPSSIRKGQSLQITLRLSDETTAVLIPKGGFYQHTGGNWIFKLSEDGKTAYKIPIQLGRQNSDYYEVIQGLKAGDKVITSSYENYGDMQELILKRN